MSACPKIKWVTWDPHVCSIYREGKSMMKFWPQRDQPTNVKWFSTFSCVKRTKWTIPNNNQSSLSHDFMAIHMLTRSCRIFDASSIHTWFINSKVPFDEIWRVLDFRFPSIVSIFSSNIVGELFNSFPNDRLRVANRQTRELVSCVWILLSSKERW